MTKEKELNFDKCSSAKLWVIMCVTKFNVYATKNNNKSANGS